MAPKCYARAMLALVRRITELVDVFWLWVFADSPAVEHDRCPQCGGTDRFDGHGTCQDCEVI